MPKKDQDKYGSKVQSLIKTSSGLKPEPKSLKGYGKKPEMAIGTSSGPKPAPRPLKEKAKPKY